MKFKNIISSTKIDNAYGIQFTQEELNNEEWKQIFQIPEKNKEFMNENELYLFNKNLKYWVSTLGRIGILDLNNNMNLCYVYNNRGYRILWIDGDHSAYRIHRLVGLLFLENNDPKYKKFIDHISTIRNDNRLNNIRWVTYHENNATKDRLEKQSKTIKESEAMRKAADNNKISVIRINLNTNEIKEYNSLTEAANDNNCKSYDIAHIIRGKQKPLQNIYSFKYKENNDEKIKEKNKRSIFQPIVRLDRDLNLIKIYYSTIYYKKDNINQLSKIFQLCRNKDINHTLCDSKWMYLKDYNKYLISKNLDPIKIDILIEMVTINTKIIRKKYTDLYDIINDGFNLDSVIKCCENDIKYCKNNNTGTTYKFRYAQHTGQTYDKICIDTDRDNIMSAEEALKYGLIDKIVDKR